MPNNDRRFYGARKAVRKFPMERCELAHISGCGAHVLERHHRDENPLNNDPSNVIVLCRCHHKLVHAGAINLDDPIMPTFYVDAQGRRRYHYKLRRDWTRRNEKLKLQRLAGKEQP